MVGTLEGDTEGEVVVGNEVVGENDGIIVGMSLGEEVVGDGDNDGIVVGMSLGNTTLSVSNIVGTGDGATDDVTEGTTEGETEGTSDDCSPTAALGSTN